MRVSSKSLLSILAAIAVALIGLGIYLATQPRIEPSVTVENFHRLHKYMTRAQVESILGKGYLDGQIVRWKSGKAEVAIAFFDFDEAASGQFFYGDRGVATLQEDRIGVGESFRLWVHQRLGW
jgi:hypothetical protein